MKPMLIDTDAVRTPGPMTKNPYQNSDPIRAFEPHTDSAMGMGAHPMAANHMDATRVHGAGIAFGKVGNKPDLSNSVPRGSIGTRSGMNPRM
jgi:hypothetical protein